VSLVVKLSKHTIEVSQKKLSLIFVILLLVMLCNIMVLLYFQENSNIYNL